MRNHDIASSFSVTCFFIFICFSFLCMKLRNGIRVHKQRKTLSSDILSISILCNGEVWCKTSFIQRDIINDTSNRQTYLMYNY